MHASVARQVRLSILQRSELSRSMQTSGLNIHRGGGTRFMAAFDVRRDFRVRVLKSLSIRMHNLRFRVNSAVFIFWFGFGNGFEWVDSIVKVFLIDDFFNLYSLAGMSRSVTVAVAYIMSVTSLNWKEALKVVRAGRAVANPNLGFQRQLQDFETYKLLEVHDPMLLFFFKYILRLPIVHTLKKTLNFFDRSYAAFLRCLNILTIQGIKTKNCTIWEKPLESCILVL